MAIQQIPLSQLRVQSQEANSRANQQFGSVLDKSQNNRQTVSLQTFGCRVNHFESELIAGDLNTNHWQRTESQKNADVCIINTCSVTAEADRQARQAIRKAIQNNPTAKIVVTGCYAQLQPEVCKAIPGVDLVVANTDKLSIARLLEQQNQVIDALESPQISRADTENPTTVKPLTRYQNRSRAFVQIQQGCDQGCTFCIIHVARGKSQSFPVTDIKRQVQQLVESGHGEIVLTGIDLGSYGEDFLDHGQQYDLVDLLKELFLLQNQLGIPFRLRLGSIDPSHISERLIDLFARQPFLCRHLHLSLQSGDALILKRMKRRYSPQLVEQKVAQLRRIDADFVFSADVMVGFPTETEAQFENTRQLIEKLQIITAHVFSYSERDGTPAARIPTERQVSKNDRKQRNQCLRDQDARLTKSWLAKQVGKTAYVLPETASNSTVKTGHKSRAESSLMVATQAQLTPGQWQKVRYVGVEQGLLLAELV